MFVDTSALLALLDGDDVRHEGVQAACAQRADDDLVTHGYVVAESLAVTRRRLGIGGVVALMDDVLPSIEVLPVDLELYVEAQRRYRAALPSGVSFVDRISLTLIEREEITMALVLDPDFARAGLEVLPGT
ncbi:MAG: PIN domain-containing protein [Chloroflexi bacterium]|nr:PIN domain-containing protein [Chloroflexota bacterium]